LAEDFGHRLYGVDRLSAIDGENRRFHRVAQQVMRASMDSTSRRRLSS
jgi:hypothetical protein